LESILLEDDRDSSENADSINMERNVNVNQKGQDPKKQEKIVDDFGNLRKKLDKAILVEALVLKKIPSNMLKP